MSKQRFSVSPMCEQRETFTSSIFQPSIAHCILPATSNFVAISLINPCIDVVCFHPFRILSQQHSGLLANEPAAANPPVSRFEYTVILDCIMSSTLATCRKKHLNRRHRAAIFNR
jgi:hypothetical protein